MHAVTRTEYRGAWNTLMALNDVEPGKLCGGGLSKARFAAETIAKWRIHRQRLPASGVFPLACDERDIQRGVLRQHVKRA
ncbi:hypothetical protein D3C87_1648320 [compost metagenome]